MRTILLPTCIVVSLLFVASNAHAQTAEQIIGGILNDLFNNNNQNPNNPNNQNPPMVRPIHPIGTTTLSIRNNSRLGISVEVLPPAGNVNPQIGNALVGIPSGGSYSTQSLAVGSRVRISGPRLRGGSQVFNLPANITVLSDGSIGQVSVNPPSVNPGPTPNNRPSAGTGNVEVRNNSGRTIRVHYTLPSGRTYNYSGSANTRLWVDLGNGAIDRTPNIATNTRVTVDGYSDENFVSRDSSLVLTVFPNSIGATSSIRPPSPAPTPPSPDIPPSPDPNPAPGVDVPRNELPTVKASPLTSAIAQQLAQRINQEVQTLLEQFDRASSRRLASFKADMLAANFSAEVAGKIESAARGGGVAAVSELFKALRAEGVNVPRPLESRHIAIATFRHSLTDLLTKLEAGNAASSMTSEFQQIKEQATNLNAIGLADAMTLTQRDLLIRDTINKAVVSSVISSGQQSIPSGTVTIIRHPWLNSQGIYLGDGHVVLTKSSDDRIIVAQADASMALNLPTSTGKSIPNSQASPSQSGIVILNPSTTGASLRYTLNGRQYQIGPGERQSVNTGTNWLIEFSPSPGLANKRYGLREASTYAFTVKDGEWDLTTQQFTFHIHNPSKQISLKCVIDQNVTDIPPGGSIERKSRLPLSVRFDRGNGTETLSKVLETKGDYHFAIGGQTKWDLFAGKPSQSDATGGEQLVIQRPSLAMLQQAAGTALFDFSGNAKPNASNGLLDALKAAK